MLAPLPGGRPSDPALPETLDAVDGSQNRSVGRPSSSAEFVELSELSKEALKEVRKREQRFEQASQLAEVPDERSPADAELIEELERHLEQESFDDAQLEMELIQAEGSLQMMRAFKEAPRTADLDAAPVRHGRHHVHRQGPPRYTGQPALNRQGLLDTCHSD